MPACQTYLGIMAWSPLHCVHMGALRPVLPHGWCVVYVLALRGVGQCSGLHVGVVGFAHVCMCGIRRIHPCGVVLPASVQHSHAQCVAFYLGYSASV